MVTQNVNLTQTTKKIPSIVHVVQGDSGRQVVAKVTDQTISGTASMSFERPDGAVYTSTATINTTDNTMSVNLTSDMLNIAGNAKITFKVTTSNKTVSTFTLVAVIEPSAGFGQTPSTASNKIYVYVNGSAVEIAKQTDVTSLTSRVGANETNIIAINNDFVKLNTNTFDESCTFEPRSNLEINPSPYPRAIKSIILHGNVKNKKIFLNRIARTQNGSHIIFLSNETNSNYVCILLKNYTDTNGLELVTLSEHNGSGITGQVLIDWSEIPSGKDVDFTSYDKALLSKEVLANAEIERVNKANGTEVYMRKANMECSNLFDLTASNFPKIALLNGFIKWIDIKGNTENKNIYLQIVARTQNGQHSLMFNGGTVNNYVMVWYPSSYTDNNGIELIELSEYNSSGIHGTMLVDWSKLFNGYSVNFNLDLKLNNALIEKNNYETITREHKNILWLGTSIPEGQVRPPYGYPNIIGKKLGLNINNQAVGASRIRKGYRNKVTTINPCGITSEYDLRNLCQTKEEKRYCVNNWEAICNEIGITYTSQTDKLDSYLAMSYESLIDDNINNIDTIVINHGYNDYGSDFYETITDEFDLYTFEGSMNFIIHRIKELNPDVKIVIVGHYQRTPDYNMEDKLESIARVWNVRYVPLWKELGWSDKTITTTKRVDSNGNWITVTEQTLTIKNQWIYDRTHPHGVATEKIASALIPYFKNDLS